jgi:hypothetical protein
MITIDQLLESVDLDFEPRWVTEDDNGAVWVHSSKPIILDGLWQITKPVGKARFIGYINLSEFDGKDWTECIYEVPRKTTGKIEKLGKLNVSSTNMTMNQNTVDTVVNALNQVIDVVNELKGE